MTTERNPQKNMPDLADLRAMPLGDIASLPAEQLAVLQADADAALQAAKSLKDWLDAAIARRYAELAAVARSAQGKDTGTIRLMDGDVTVIADLPKKVDWDQSLLASLAARIREAGEDPTDYVDIAFKVPERKYAAWPPHIRSAFEAARTVKTGKQSFRLQFSESSEQQRGRPLPQGRAGDPSAPGHAPLFPSHSTKE